MLHYMQVTKLQRAHYDDLKIKTNSWESTLIMLTACTGHFFPLLLGGFHTFYRYKEFIPTQYYFTLFHITSGQTPSKYNNKMLSQYAEGSLCGFERFFCIFSSILKPFCLLVYFVSLLVIQNITPLQCYKNNS